jgi:hypothetical protein
MTNRLNGHGDNRRAKHPGANILTCPCCGGWPECRPECKLGNAGFFYGERIRLGAMLATNDPPNRRADGGNSPAPI